MHKLSLNGCIVLLFIAAGVIAVTVAGELCQDRLGRPIELDSAIDINSAPEASLMRLSGIGRSRAGQIVSYREANGEANSPAFRNLDDVQKIKGIGPKTAEAISEHVTFEQGEIDGGMEDKQD